MVFGRLFGSKQVAPANGVAETQETGPVAKFFNGVVRTGTQNLPKLPRQLSSGLHFVQHGATEMVDQLQGQLDKMKEEMEKMMGREQAQATVTGCGRVEPTAQPTGPQSGRAVPGDRARAEPPALARRRPHTASWSSRGSARKS